MHASKDGEHVPRSTTWSPRTVVSHGSFLHLDAEGFIDTAAGAAFDAVDIWRRACLDVPAVRLKRHADSAGVAVDSVCRGGYLVEPDGSSTLRESIAALEFAAALGARTLVVVAGPVTTSVGHAVKLTRAALAELAPHAEGAGVVVALEPFHPMFVGERSSVVSLETANNLVESIDSPWIQLAIDAYHLWWDPALAGQLDRATGRIAALHVSDWLVPLQDVLRGRGVPGEGIIPLDDFICSVANTGYSGSIEIEVLNDRFRNVSPATAARELKASLDLLIEHAALSPTLLS